MSDPAPHRPPAPRTRRGIKIVLAVSLALNLLVAGLVGGAILGSGGFGGGDRDRDPDLRSLGLGPFALALPREERQGLLDRIDREALRQDRREIGGALRALQAALRASPFDRDAAEAALRRSRVVAEGIQGRGHALLLDRLDEMSPAQRAELADRLSRALRRVPGQDRP